MTMRLFESERDAARDEREQREREATRRDEREQRRDDAVRDAEQTHAESLQAQSAIRAAERERVAAIAERAGMTPEDLDDARRDERERDHELREQAEQAAREEAEAEQERREYAEHQAELARLEREPLQENIEHLREREAEHHQDTLDAERAAETPDYFEQPPIEPASEPVRDLFDDGAPEEPPARAPEPLLGESDEAQPDRHTADLADSGGSMGQSAAEAEAAARDAEWARQGDLPAEAEPYMRRPRRRIERRVVVPEAFEVRPRAAAYMPSPRRRR